MINLLTLIIWWAYALLVIAKSMIGLRIPETRRTTAAERYFYVRNMASSSFMGGCMGNLRVRRYLVPVCEPIQFRPPISHWESGYIQPQNKESAMTAPNTDASASIQNSTNNPSNPNNKDILSKIKNGLAESVPLIELMQATTLITPRDEPLQLDHMKSQGFSVITNNLINKLENVRLLVDQNPDACSYSSKLEELIFEAMGLISFVQIFQVSEDQLSSLHSSQLSGLYFVTQRALDCVKESQTIIEVSLQSVTSALKDNNIALPEIFWRLIVLENTAVFLQDLVRSEENENILLANRCVIVFDQVLHELGESILNITNDLKDVNPNIFGISKIREQLKDANNQIVTLLTFLLPNGHSEYVTIYKEFLSTFDLSLGNVREIIKNTSEELSTVFVEGGDLAQNT